VCWGSNHSGQVDVPSQSFANLTVCGYFAIGQTANGSIVFWGDNSQNEFHIPSNFVKWYSLTGGNSFACGLGLHTWPSPSSTPSSSPSPSLSSLPSHSPSVTPSTSPVLAFASKVTDVSAEFNQSAPGANLLGTTTTGSSSSGSVNSGMFDEHTSHQLDAAGINSKGTFST